jgi:P-type Cu+ transporter
MSDTVFRQNVAVEGDAESAQLVEDRSAKVIDGIRVELDGAAHVGEVSEPEFHFTDAVTGSPIANLKPYLSAAGHVIVASQGLYTIDHGRDEAFDASGQEIWPLPGTSFGPTSVSPPL